MSILKIMLNIFLMVLLLLDFGEDIVFGNVEIPVKGIILTVFVLLYENIHVVEKNIIGMIQ